MCPPVWKPSICRVLGLVILIGNPGPGKGRILDTPGCSKEVAWSDPASQSHTTSTASSFLFITHGQAYGPSWLSVIHLLISQVSRSGQSHAQFSGPSTSNSELLPHPPQLLNNTTSFPSPLRPRRAALTEWGLHGALLDLMKSGRTFPRRGNEKKGPLGGTGPWPVLKAWLQQVCEKN